MQQQAMDLNSQSIATSNAAHGIEIQLLELQNDLNKFEVNRDAEALDQAQRASQDVKGALAQSELLDSIDDSHSLLPEIREQYARFDQSFRELSSPYVTETMLPE